MASRKFKQIIGIAEILKCNKQLSPKVASGHQKNVAEDTQQPSFIVKSFDDS